MPASLAAPVLSKRLNRKVNLAFRADFIKSKGNPKKMALFEDYNADQPHRSLNNMTPIEFATNLSDENH